MNIKTKIKEELIQELEKEQKENLYRENVGLNTKNYIGGIKRLFEGYLTEYYNILIGCALFFIGTSLVTLDYIGLLKGKALLIYLLIMMLTLFPIWGFYMNWKGKKIDKNYNDLISNLNNFYRLKGEIENNFNVLLGKIISDLKSGSINIQDIEVIKSSLGKITLNYSQIKEIDSLLKPEIYIVSFKKNKQQFIDLMTRIKTEEMKYIDTLKIKVREKIQIWISHHQSELQELEKSIEIQANETQTNDGKIALESQKLRLQSYIESINNLVK